MFALSNFPREVPIVIIRSGLPEFRQLDFRKYDFRQWRKSNELLAKVQWNFANWWKSWEYIGESTVESRLLKVWWIVTASARTTCVFYMSTRDRRVGIGSGPDLDPIGSGSGSVKVYFFGSGSLESFYKNNIIFPVFFQFSFILLKE